MGKQTKVLLVSGENDYGVNHFEEYSEQNDLSLKDWYYVLKDSYEKKEYVEEGDFSFSVELFEFGEVDNNFIEFIRNEIIDDDDAKNMDFFIVEEDELI